MTTLPATQIGLGKLATGPNSLGLIERPLGHPGPGEALVRVTAAGICGTDLHIADDEFPSNPPVIMGHEVTGTVAVVGDGVDASWANARVAVETYFSYCERCEFCRNGKPNLCDRRESIGSKVDGGFAPWLLVPSRNLHRLPDSVGRRAGSLTEPLACVANLLFDPGIVNPGDTVLVTGPGTMGVLIAQAARAAGGEVLLAGLAQDAARLELAGSLGIPTEVVGSPFLTESESFDVVCEASGTGPAASTCLDLVARRGRYVQVGIFGGPVEIPLDLALYKELIMTSGNASTPASWRRALILLEAEFVQLDPLVTDAFRLQEWRKAFDATRAGHGMKVLLEPDELEADQLGQEREQGAAP